MNTLLSIEAASRLVLEGHALALAGAEPALDQLPAGNWIGGTIPYFMTDTGGVQANDRVFVTPLPRDANVTFRHYDPQALPAIVADGPENGFSLAIIPAGCTAHRRFAEESRHVGDAFLKPVAGWIAGVDVNDLGRVTPKVYLGRTHTKLEEGAVVAHVALPAGRLASLEIINLFEQDDQEVLRFPQTGFTATVCTVDGQTEKFASFLARRGNTDGRLPLVGDFGGAAINVSIQSIDPGTGEVKLYAPVFPDVEYRIARPVGDYAAEFVRRVAAHGDHEHVVFSCNCVLNYLYGQLEGKRLGPLQGPVTFGEIAYQLLNQTLVMVRID